MLSNRQVTTDAKLRSSERNRIVRQANIKCHAIGCEAQSIRYSNLCSKCEYGYLNWNNKIFGKPTAKTMEKALEIVKAYYQADIESGVFKTWAKQISQTMVRPRLRHSVH